MTDKDKQQHLHLTLIIQQHFFKVFFFSFYINKYSIFTDNKHKINVIK